MRVLLLSSRLDRGREQALRSLFQLDGRLDILPSGALPDLAVYQSVVLDGPQSGVDEERLQHFVADGGSLLAIGAAPDSGEQPLARLLGAVRGGPMPQVELWGSLVSQEHYLLDRLDREFLLLDSFAPLQPLADDLLTLATVQWALQARMVAFERPVERGRIVVTSLGNGPAALESPTLSTLLRRASRPAPQTAKRALGVAIIGYGIHGGMGYLHGTAVNAVPGLDLVAVVDRVPERLVSAREDFPGVQAYEDAASIMNNPDVDIAIVATPPVAHSTIAHALLQAGKHVVVEKPLCLSITDADTLLLAAERRGVVLTVNHNRRWDADYLAIRKEIGAGRLGDLFNVETFAGDFAHPCSFWHSDEGVSGGAVYDWGAHHIDWILQLMPGTPASVTAIAHKRVWHDVTNADQVRVRLGWDDGREAEFFYSDVTAVRRPKFYVQGTAGTLVGHYRPVSFERLDPSLGYVREDAHYAEAPAELTLARYEGSAGISETRLPLPSSARYPLHRNLADHLLLGEPLAVTPQSARAVVAVLEAATRSAREGGRPVTPSA